MIATEIESGSVVILMGLFFLLGVIVGAVIERKLSGHMKRIP